MYTFVSVLVIAAVLFACTASVFAKGRALRVAALSVSLALLAAGIFCLIAASVRAGALFANASLDAQFREWASDTYGLWARGAGITSAVLGGILLLAALIRHPLKRIRAAAGAILAALLLIFGGLYAVTVANAVADLVTPVQLCSIAYACLVPLAAYADTAISLFKKR